MNKKRFSATQWLQREIDSIDELPFDAEKSHDKKHPQSKNRFPRFINKSPLKKSVMAQGPEKFSPLECFIPGWKGDSLLCNNAVKFDRLLGLIQLDVKNEFFKAKDFPRTIKMGIYNEFLSYAEATGLQFEKLDDLGQFWNEIHGENLKENEKLQSFLEIYAFRVVTIAFLKIRFISFLAKECEIELTDKALLYSTSFLSQIFKKGSVSELQSRALETNLYSWYRPGESMKQIMQELLNLSQALTITEITKQISLKTQVAQDQPKIYSHALSHLSTGLFLNSLQINFPLWLETLGSPSPLPQGNLEEERILSCKYFGDYIESLSLSHWLAQENNAHFKWDEFLCPDFKGLEFVSGTFTKICNELQFLTFLAQKSNSQGSNPVSMISKVMSGHFKNRKNHLNRGHLSLEASPFYSSTYDRIVLNLCHFPKNNPQHYLINQISDQIKYLKTNGYLFVLSSKKLFVPSLKDRLGHILSELKTQVILDLEQVKGKGELANYIYIFRKKSSFESDNQLCSYFKFSAELENFQKFSTITEHLRSFFLAHLTQGPAMAFQEYEDSFKLQYYQEAIVNGMLINSTSEDTSRITHPTFFKNLLESCVPLDTIFDIKSFSLSEKNIPNSPIMNLDLDKDLNYFIAVDFRNNGPKLELHPMETFRSIHSTYGEVLCSYFELKPKIPGVNPNILRNYFASAIGKQVIHLSFSAGFNFVKASLSKLLVPKFLTETDTIPENLRTGMSTLDLKEADLLSSNPKEILKGFVHIDQITREILPRYACDILSRFSNFERTLENLLNKFEETRLEHKISFYNPLIQNRLCATPTQQIYPSNQDVFVEFMDGESPQDIHHPLTLARIKTTIEGDVKLFSLEMCHFDKVIVRLHSEEPMILFLNFILSGAHQVPISKILKGIHAPSLDDLKTILIQTQEFNNHFEDLLGKVKAAIANAMRIQVISAGKKA